MLPSSHLRQIVLDTETTGLNPRTGDRILEIGGVEIFNRQLTGKTFHRYINPERDSEEGALAVHGLTTDFLRDKPKFAEVVAEFRDFVSGAEVVIHNAPFDIGFLNAEYEKLGLGKFTDDLGAAPIDTLVQAKQMFPGKRNSLDALCDRFGISNAHRILHGALLDAELLAEVYLAMTRGQNSLAIDLGGGPVKILGDLNVKDAPLPSILVVAADVEELSAHALLLAGLDKDFKGPCIWRQEPVAAVE